MRYDGILRLSGCVRLSFQPARLTRREFHAGKLGGQDREGQFRLGNRTGDA